MKAVNNYIVVAPSKDKSKKIGGLLVTEETDVDTRYKKGTIISVGNLVEGLEKGDVIYYDKMAGHDISYQDALLRVIRNMDVVLVE